MRTIVLTSVAALGLAIPAGADMGPNPGQPGARSDQHGLTRQLADVGGCGLNARQTASDGSYGLSGGQADFDRPKYRETSGGPADLDQEGR